MVAMQVRAAYTQEFRLEAVRLVQSGQSQVQVCQALGIPKASLGSWVRQAKNGVLKLSSYMLRMLWQARSRLSKWR
ncbi:MAG: transposase [Burkholderiaceae bacterium]|nr:transposase [Burkholderiaceae bacterium]